MRRTTSRQRSTLCESRSSFAVRANLFAVFAFFLPAAGCSNPTGMSAEFRESLRHYTLEQNYDIALHDQNADARRRAVNRIVQSGHVTDADAFRVLDVAARTDPKSQVRCAAILGLKNYRDTRPIAPLLAILNPKAHPGESAPASPPVRWDATTALGHLAEDGLIPPDRLNETLDVLVAMLLNDPYRDVKMAAARGLGSIPDARALRALIASLRHKDFGIAYEAQNSLSRLTGRPYQYDADAWDAWLRSVANPFDRAANAASRPPASQPTG